jgi:putative DNA primase/helicase
MTCEDCRFDGTPTCSECGPDLDRHQPRETAAELQQIAAAVEQRSTEMLAALDPEKDLIDPRFVKQCLDANERGDGVLFAALNRGKFLRNINVIDVKKLVAWYKWNGHVWQIDDYNDIFNAAEAPALAYQQQADMLADEIKKDGISKTIKTDEGVIPHPQAWKLDLLKKYKARTERLRSDSGISKTIKFAPIVDQTMAAAEGDFNQKPWLLPCKNGVIDLQTGLLVRGCPGDLLTNAIDIDYDPHADYADWQTFLEEICDSKEVAAFIKRSIGYAATGFSYEQYIWCFVGAGRNGKGVLFDLIGDILGPYYHEISRAMLVEQRTEPGPNAASEHKYSLIGKRLILGSETNKGQKIDGAAIKSLTGEDRINCRPNFKSEINFKATHSLFLQTNHLPAGLTRDFALKQRALKIEFPWMYVDDPEAEAKTAPNHAGRFKLKDKNLKQRLRLCKPGILRWIVEGCLEWQQIGITPPDCIIKAVDDLSKEEDYIGQFMDDCLTHTPDQELLKTYSADIYDVFRWWWAHNMDSQERRTPGIKSLNTQLRDRGCRIDKIGGKVWMFQYFVDPYIAADAADWQSKKKGSS